MTFIYNKTTTQMNTHLSKYKLDNNGQIKFNHRQFVTLSMSMAFAVNKLLTKTTLKYKMNPTKFHIHYKE